jgi:GR25 family glycosyltransferase involved in LPS biosynthesis
MNLFMKIKDFISAGFYINLDYRTDRNQHMIDELTNHNLIDVVKRFSAVKAFDKTEYIRNDDSKMLSATLAAAESHKQIIKIAKENNYENVLILEDDAKFYNTENYKGIDVIESALDQLSKIDNWEIFFLGSNLHDTELNLISPNLIKCDCCVSTQAYILNKSTYDIILNQTEIRYMDVFLNNTFKEKYITYPLSLIQKSDDVSDIGGHTSMTTEFWESQYNKPFKKI